MPTLAKRSRLKECKEYLLARPGRGEDSGTARSTAERGKVAMESEVTGAIEASFRNEMALFHVLLFALTLPGIDRNGVLALAMFAFLLIRRVVPDMIAGLWPR